ncbi:MAG: hypothetical protein JWN62_4299 [Acidimicrobiales bacterium]|nr:hypothetical protein [Acidimicrobiales bacterium]
MRRSTSFRCAVALVAVLFSGAVAVQPAAADTVGQQEQQVKDVVAEIDRMQQKVDQYNEDYLAALNDQAAVEAQIAQSQQQIAVQQASLAVLQGQLANVAVEQFMGGGGGALGPLFDDPAQLDDTLQREHLATVAVDAGSVSTDDYETLLSDLDTAQKQLVKKQQEAIDLAARAAASKAKAEQAASDLQARLVQEKNKLGDLIQQEQDRQAAAAQAKYEQEQAAARAAAAAQAAANTPKSSGNSSGSNSGSGSSSSGSSSSGNSSSGNSSSNSGSSDSNSSSGSGSSAGSSSSSDSSSSDSGGGNPPPVSGRAQVAVAAAASQLGVPYRFAQSSPGVAFDCSGLTAYAWGQAGVGIPHQSSAQYASTPHVPKDQAQPGDLIFYYSPISHVGIYVGGGSMIHAPNTGSVVSYTAVHWDKVVGVSRPG